MIESGTLLHNPQKFLIDMTSWLCSCYLIFVSKVLMCTQRRDPPIYVLVLPNLSVAQGGSRQQSFVSLSSD